MKELQQNNALKELFSEPVKLIELYNTLSGNQYEPNTPVDISLLPDAFITVQNSTFSFIKNNIDFLIDNKLVIIIEQPSIDESILRHLVDYLLFLTNAIIHKGIDVFAEGENIINLPLPEFYVLYNGKDDFPDVKILNMSDAYKSYSPPLIANYIACAKIKIINTNQGHNEELIRGNAGLYEYVSGGISNAKERKS